MAEEQHQAAPEVRGRLFREAFAHPPLWVPAVAFPVLAGGAAVLRAWLLAQGVNAAVLETVPLEALPPIVQGLVLATLAQAVFRYLGGAFSGMLAAEVKARLRARLARALPHSPATAPGTFAVLLQDAIEGLDAFFRGYLPAVFEAAFVPLGVLLLVLTREPLSALVLFLTAPLIPLFMILIGRWAEGVTRRQWRALFALGAFFFEALKGLAVLRVLGAAGRTAVRLRSLAEEHRIATLAVLRVAFLSALALELLATLSTAIVAVEVGLRLLYGRLDYATAFFVLLLAPEFYTPLRNLGAQFHPAESAREAMARIASLLEAKPPPPPPPCPGEPGPGLVVRDLSFAYPGGPRLEGIELEARPGELFVITGKSGVGKTTLLKLLLGLLRPESGAICLNGRPVAPERFAYIPQKPFFLAGSVRENLTLAQPDAREEAMQAALAEVGLANLPLDRRIGEGGEGLSAGERQRLALARALLKEPDAILLDEPTAHLDPASEHQVIETLKRLKQHRPVVATSHRPALIAAADRKLSLEDRA